MLLAMLHLASGAALDATAGPCSTWKTLRNTSGSFCDAADSGTPYAKNLTQLIGPPCSYATPADGCCYAPLGYDGGAPYGTSCSTVCAGVVGFHPRLGADDAYCSKSDGSPYGNCFCGPENRPLETPTNAFVERWADHETSGDHDVTFWRTSPDPSVGGSDYRSVILGDRVNLGYSTPTSPTATMLVPSNSTSACGSSPYLKEPVALQLVWADHGSGGSEDGSIWRIVPPAGYVALGDVVQKGYAEPTEVLGGCALYGTCVCTVKQECVAPTVAHWVYDDAGTGSDNDVMVWGNNDCQHGYGMTKSAEVNGYDSHDASKYGVQMYCLKPDCVLTDPVESEQGWWSWIFQ